MQLVNERIEINTAVMLGKPVVKGTRITVQSIVEELANGYSIADVLTAHPLLTEADVYAALQYVSEIMKNEKVYTLAS